MDLSLSLSHSLFHTHAQAHTHTHTYESQRARARIHTHILIHSLTYTQHSTLSFSTALRWKLVIVDTYRERTYRTRLDLSRHMSCVPAWVFGFSNPLSNLSIHFFLSPFTPSDRILRARIRRAHCCGRTRARLLARSHRHTRERARQFIVSKRRQMLSSSKYCHGRVSSFPL